MKLGLMTSIVHKSWGDKHGTEAIVDWLYITGRGMNIKIKKINNIHCTLRAYLDLDSFFMVSLGTVN